MGHQKLKRTLMQTGDILSPTIHPGDVGFSYAASSLARKQNLGKKVFEIFFKELIIFTKMYFLLYGISFLAYIMAIMMDPAMTPLCTWERSIYEWHAFGLIFKIFTG